MSHRDSPPVRPPRPDRRPLLSVCTILILSGFLLGMSIGTHLSGEMRLLVSIAGLAGLVAYLGLDHVSLRRRLQLERDEQDYMQTRLLRHLISGDSSEIDREELMALARAATETVDLEELLPAGSSA